MTTLTDSYIKELSLTPAFWKSDKSFDIMGFSRALEAAVTQSVTKSPIIDDYSTMNISFTLGAKKSLLKLTPEEVVNNPPNFILDKLMGSIRNILL